MNGNHAELKDYRKALEGLDFPASKSAIARKAADVGGIDTEVLHTLENLPDRTYESMADLQGEIANVYAAIGGLDGGGPAAPSEVTEKGKDVVEAAADPRAGEAT